MSLVTGERVHRYSWDILPISTDVIERVNEISRSQDQPLISTNFKYQWEPAEYEINYESESDDDGDDHDNCNDILPLPPNMLIVGNENTLYSDNESDTPEETQDTVEAEIEGLENNEELGAPAAVNEHVETINDLILEQQNDADDEEGSAVNDEVLYNEAR